ncbi:MBL fold metallo-hydrolase [Bordetella sp. BOR01]|uniref:MBL fold metallo-hydrolase n=1 Tax=Bordetella sp. BOR01 TaxID=2854779 RepID=UPI001C465537|nr:MBL fold metallo-hydrolase [Bordetella sp. BOR01]MBV7484886.1 MBL fold metallo-hydrolase [Bordetella sp. BOR01]
MKDLAPIDAFFDEATQTVTYLLADAATRQAVVIDPVLDYDHASGEASTASADRVLDAARQAGLAIAWVLETHVHADHLSAAPYIKQRTGARVGIGEYVRQVQNVFRPIFNLESVSGDGSEFDRLFSDGDVLAIGSLAVEVIHTPGHTPACVSYKIGDAVFVGDTLFMPDYGTARADFPGGCPQGLYRSIRRLLALPGHTRLYMCHDYKAPGRDTYAWETTVALQRMHNVHVHDGVTEDQFVAMRRQRDATLSAPRLMLPSIQVNIRAGRWPQAEANGVHYLKIPMRSAGSALS